MYFTAFYRIFCILMLISKAFGWFGTNQNSENCISCDSKVDATCRTNTTFTEIKKCPSPDCYHYINEATDHHRRGCVSDLSEQEAKACIEGSDECKVCNSEKCNSKMSFAHCFFCSFTSNSECGLSAESLSSKLCKKYVDECFTFIDKIGITKGCLSSANEMFITQCRSNEEKCEICSTSNGNYCNKRLIDRDEACVDCDSLNDEKCISQPQEIHMKMCSKMKSSPPKGCYLSKNRDHIKRGCIQDLDSEHMNDCLKQSDTCKSCQSRFCNFKVDFQECFICKGHENPDCSAAVASSINTAICKEYNSTCLVGIDRVGYTHRRCTNISHATKDLNRFPNGFEVCTENKCNNQIYPANRLACYQCNGGEECNFVDSGCSSTPIQPIEPKACGIWSLQDQCYTYFSKDERMYRGCLSDQNSRLICDREYVNITGICVKCRDSKCNSKPKFQTPTLSCVECSGYEECTFGQDPKTVVKCKNNVTFGNNESCFIRFSSDTGFALRGCTLDAHLDPNWCNKTDDCEMCSANACNIKNVQYQFCVRCNSKVDSNCDILGDSYEHVVSCDGDPYTYKDRGCFILNEHGSVIRGCVNELTTDEFNTCLSDSSCKICAENICNTENSGVRLLTSSTMISVIIYQALLKNVE